MSPKIRETLYHVGVVVVGVAGIAQLWWGFDAGSVELIVTGLMTMFGVSNSATAGKNTHQQRKDGTLDSPAERIVKDVQAVRDAQANATAELERVKQAVTSAVGIVPGMGPLAQQIINSTSDSLSDRILHLPADVWQR